MAKFCHTENCHQCSLNGIGLFISGNRWNVVPEKLRLLESFSWRQATAHKHHQMGQPSVQSSKIKQGENFTHFVQECFTLLHDEGTIDLE